MLLFVINYNLQRASLLFIFNFLLCSRIDYWLTLWGANTDICSWG